MSIWQSIKYCRTLNNKLVSIISLIIFNLLLTSVATANIAPVILFQPPPEEEQPESTEGAASRQHQQCTPDFVKSQQKRYTTPNLNLTAIVPDSNYGLTVAERPNFWVYLPKTSAKQAILSIREEGKIPHWQQSIPLTREAGIIGITLSKDAPTLEVGKSYQWALVLVCGNKPNPNDPVVAAWIKRVDKSSAMSYQLPSKTKLEQAAWYAKEGIWYDALSILRDEKTSSLENGNDTWAKYLRSGGLDKIANEPIVR
ncbi:MAG: DUF928 domain-containing protein [Xenococcaceae cyanobacterium MO_188.B29]|nr:DUF928 domain-containing protein [Xenococcaceae cyanobacterium MO_188.B29]